MKTVPWEFTQAAPVRNFFMVAPLAFAQFFQTRGGSKIVKSGLDVCEGVDAVQREIFDFIFGGERYLRFLAAPSRSGSLDVYWLVGQLVRGSVRPSVGLLVTFVKK